ncbi:Neuron navigator 2 [Trichinella pseudospiralis]|uniref:Neuron navigator 2 n=1 Tax=Trichinella pseudospiralis TaxID=6337 RepID=A0A0V1JW06_TRIPS|nr:Neuron navigator 2 [Trichinella pseudospiralis]
MLMQQLASSTDTNMIREQSQTLLKGKDLADQLIYTGWANRYLEKHRKKRVIRDLQKDLQDSLALVDVIECVIGDKIPNVKKRPKNAVQILENIAACLQYLADIGVKLNGVTVEEIRDGQVKSILGLFYSLSWYKKQQNEMIMNSNNNNNNNNNSARGVSTFTMENRKANRIPIAKSNCNNAFKDSSPSSFNSNIPSSTKTSNGLSRKIPEQRIRVDANGGVLHAEEVSCQKTRAPATTSLSTKTSNTQLTHTQSTLSSFSPKAAVIKQLPTIQSAPTTPSRLARPSFVTKPKEAGSEKWINPSVADLKNSKIPSSSTAVQPDTRKMPQQVQVKSANIKSKILAPTDRKTVKKCAAQTSGGFIFKPLQEIQSSSHQQKKPEAAMKLSTESAVINCAGAKPKSSGSPSTSCLSSHSPVSKVARISHNQPSKIISPTTRRGIPKPTLAVKGTAKEVQNAAAKVPIITTSNRKFVSDIKMSRYGAGVCLKSLSESNTTATTLPSYSLSVPKSVPNTAAVQNSDQRLTSSAGNCSQSNAPASVVMVSNNDRIEEEEDNNNNNNSNNNDNNNNNTMTNAVVGVVSPITQRRKMSTALTNAKDGFDCSSDNDEQSDTTSSQTSDNVSVICCPPLCGEELYAAATKSKAETVDNVVNRRSRGRLETTFDCSDGVVVTQEICGEKLDNDPDLQSIVPMDCTLPSLAFNAMLMNSTQQKASSDLDMIVKSSDHAGATNTRCEGANGKESSMPPKDKQLNQPTAAKNEPDCNLTAYARRMQDRFREGLEAAQNVLINCYALDSSFEDSSSCSLSSDISVDDYGTDDWTGSSGSDYVATSKTDLLTDCLDAQANHFNDNLKANSNNKMTKIQKGQESYNPSGSFLESTITEHSRFKQPTVGGYNSLDRKKRLAKQTASDDAELWAMVSPRNARASKGACHASSDINAGANAGNNSTMSRSMVEENVISATPIKSNGQQHLKRSQQLLSPRRGVDLCLKCTANGSSGLKPPLPTNRERNLLKMDPPLLFSARQTTRTTTTNDTFDVHSGSKPLKLVPKAPGSARSLPIQRNNHGEIYAGFNNGKPVDRLHLDEVHGSSLSLSSNSSSLYSSIEEKYQAEIRKLHKEVEAYKDKVQTLTTQQTTYAHVVAAFEQSLKSMTKRVQALTASSHQKDIELHGLRQEIDLLRMPTISVATAENERTSDSSNTAAVQRSQNNDLCRHLSTESLKSTASQGSSSSLCKMSLPDIDKKNRRGWLRSSFRKAFSKHKKNKMGSVSDAEESHANGRCCAKGGRKFSICDRDIEELICSLRKKLIEKDCALTDLRLEALTSAQHVDQLKEALYRIKSEVNILKESNSRLRRRAARLSQACSHGSLPALIGDDQDLDVSREILTISPLQLGVKSMQIRVAIAIEPGWHPEWNTGQNDQIESNIMIARCQITDQMQWKSVECQIWTVFKEYMLRVDPVSGLGLDERSVFQCSVGSCVVEPSSLSGKSTTTLTAFQLFVEMNTDILLLHLRGAVQGAFDALAFETLIPKPVVQRYATLLLEHRRVILSRTCGADRHTLARSLVRHCVLKSNGVWRDDAVFTFDANEPNSANCVRQFLDNISGNQWERAFFHYPQRVHISFLYRCASQLPIAVIFNGFSTLSQSAEIFAALSKIPAHQCPYTVVVTGRSASTAAATDLQFRHDFRWILCGSQVEPMRGMLARCLRQRLVDSEVRRNVRLATDLNDLFEWLSQLWAHLCKYIETFQHFSDAPIDAKIFLDCPMDRLQARQWFLDVWKRLIDPHLMKMTVEDLQVYGFASHLQELVSFITDTWPWIEENNDLPGEILSTLTSVQNSRTDVPLESKLLSNYAEKDPLMSLIRLQQTSKLQEQIENSVENYVHHHHHHHHHHHWETAHLQLLYQEEPFMPWKFKKSSESHGREIIIMRHAERVDDVFVSWSDKALRSGNYCRFDLNLPPNLRCRYKDALESYIRWTCDPPITVNGKEMAKSLGKMLASKKKNIYTIYSSPALRCVQTASAFAETYGKHFSNRCLKIRVEGGLYDFIHDNIDVVPNFADLALLKKWNLNVDMKYRSVIKAEKVLPKDFQDGFADRCKLVFDGILKQLPNGHAALIVTHAPCFNAFRTYIQRPITNREQMMKTIQRTPYLFMISYIQNKSGDWLAIPPPVESFSHKANK